MRNSQTRRISAAADQATQKLNFARRTISDKAIVAEVDTLLAIVPEFTDILKATTDTVDQQIGCRASGRPPRSWKRASC